MSFALGEPISSEVSNQVQTLQNLVGRKVTDGVGVEEITYYMNAKTPWIKLTSTIAFDAGEDGEEIRRFFGKEGNDLAKENVLFNLDPKQTNPDLPAASEVSALYGVRPRPGITNMSIKSHNRFGSLRTATVNFTVFSPEQMEIMELLYMRPGFSVLLEFGHSVNISQVKSDSTPSTMQETDLSFENELKTRFFDGNVNTESLLNEVAVVADTIGYEVNNTSVGVDLFNQDTPPNSDAIIKLINQKRIENNYAYDAVFGLVKNFNWTVRPDGGYDCTTSIVSKGEIIESLTVDVSPLISQIGSITELFPDLAQQAAVARTEFAVPDTVSQQTAGAIPSQQEVDFQIEQIEQDSNTSTEVDFGIESVDE